MYRKFIKFIAIVLVSIFFISYGGMNIPNTLGFSNKRIDIDGSKIYITSANGMSFSVSGYQGKHYSTPLGELYDLYITPPILIDGISAVSLTVLYTDTDTFYSYSSYVYNSQKGFILQNHISRGEQYIDKAFDYIYSQNTQTATQYSVNSTQYYNRNLYVVKNTSSMLSPYSVSSNDSAGPIKFGSSLGASPEATFSIGGHSSNVDMYSAVAIRPIINITKGVNDTRVIGAAIWLNKDIIYDAFKEGIRKTVSGRLSGDIYPYITSMNVQFSLINQHNESLAPAWASSRESYTYFNPPENIQNSRVNYISLFYSIATTFIPTSPYLSLIGKLISTFPMSSNFYSYWNAIASDITLTFRGNISIPMAEFNSDNVFTPSYHPLGSFFPLFASYTEISYDRDVAVISGSIWVRCRGYVIRNDIPRASSSGYLSFPIPVSLRFRVVQP